MTDQISGVVKTLQKIWEDSWSFLLALSLGSGFVLFMPDNCVSLFGLDEIRKTDRAYFGVAFILLTVLLMCRAIPLVHKRYQGHLTLKRWHKRLHDLTPAEKDILREYLYGKTRTVHLDITGGVAAGLEAANIIVRFSSVGYPAGAQEILCAYNIQQWAWDYIRKHPVLLKDDKGNGSP